METKEERVQHWQTYLYSSKIWRPILFEDIIVVNIDLETYII